MKVVHLSYADGGGGAAKAAYRIHKGLVELGLDSTMLVSKRFSGDPSVRDPGSPLGRLWAHAATYLDLAPLRLTQTADTEISSVARVGTPVLGRLARLQPTIVQLHWICAGFMSIESLGSIGVPVVWRMADMWPLAGAHHYVGDDLRYRDGYRAANRPARESGPDLNSWVWRRKRKAYARIRDLTVVSPSRWLADCARASPLLQGRRIEVIPTGQNLEVFRPIPRSVAREVLRLPQDGKYVMTASMGIGNPRKGVQLLMEALAMLHGRGYRLLVAGDDPGSAAQLPLPAHALGRLDDDTTLALAYSAADVFVAPSLEENLANTVIEAMACGVPCVAFEIGGMPDIIRHGQNGFLARPFEPAGLASGIAAVLGAGDGAAALGAAARSTVEQDFCARVQARRYAALYEDVAARPSV